MNLETQLVQLGRPSTGTVNTPVYRASTIVFADLREFDDAKHHDRHALTYGRYGTPTVFELENAVAALEAAHAAALVPSGLAAITTSLQAFLRPGDHLLMPQSVYGPARRFATDFLGPRGISTSFYAPTCGAGIVEHLTERTRVVYLESPGSLTFEMQDVPAIAHACRERGVMTIADNTWATPACFQPLRHGVDVSLQAATKYLVGHSDAMLGTIAATRDAWPALLQAVSMLGLCVSPDDAFLGSRGMRTMAVRLERHARNAMQVASWLCEQPQVERVCYPPLAGDPGHALWQRDFRGASGLMGVFLKPTSDADAVRRMVDGLRVFRLGGSWGGYESLVFPADPAGFQSLQATKGAAYLRLHVGLESPADMIDDLRSGLMRLHAS